MTTTTRRMVYAAIANAVLAGLPEPRSQEFGPDTVVRLTFDTQADATEWARWLGPDCVLDYTVDMVESHQSLRCYHGKRSDWSWQIVGREPRPDFDSKIWSCPEGCGYHIADGPVPDGEDSTDDLIFQHLEEHRPTVEQVTIAALSPDSLPVRCPRCGHDEDRVHTSQDGRRLCLDCEGFCAPVVVPVEGRGQ